MSRFRRYLQEFRILKYVCHVCVILLETGFLVAMMEFFNQGTIRAALSWAYHHPNELFLNVWIAFGILLAAHALIGRSRPAFLAVFAVTLAVGVISAMKVQTTGTPLFLWEVLLSSETRDAAGPLNRALNSEILWGITVGILVVIVIARMRQFRVILPVAERLILAVLSVFMLYTVVTDKPIPLKSHFNLFTISWDQAESYLLNGYMLSTAMAIEPLKPEKPPGTGKGRIAAIMDSAPKSTDIDPAVKPNIIVILSESFWDPTQIKSAKFSEDPIPFVHSLQQTSTGGTLLSPQFGGGTANVEFEVLSGNSMRFLPGDAIAYIEYMTHGVDSLASILARQGYTSTSINPFYNWFFNSRNVYKNLGFSRFIASEHFDPVYKGPYLGDRQVMTKIMEETAKSPGPDFIFANTMENHGLYKDKFNANVNSIQVSGNFSEETQNILENYATGINDADTSLKTLVEHYKESKEPTIIVYFGDHLPPFGDDFKAYKDAKYTTGQDDPNFLTKMYSTPLIVWNNYMDAPKEQLHMSPSFLGPYVLHLAKREGTYFTDYLYNLSKKIPIIPPKSDFSAMNIKAEDLSDYRSLEYDNLFGGRYGYAKIGITSRIVNPKFELGYGNPVIRDVSVKDGKLVVDGGRFESDSEIFWNDSKLKTTFRSHETLAGELPKDDQAKNARIQVRLIDSKRTVIAKSDEFEFRMSP